MPLVVAPVVAPPPLPTITGDLVGVLTVNGTKVEVVLRVVRVRRPR